MSTLRTMLATATAALVLCACGGGGGEGASMAPTPPANSNPVTPPTDRGTLIITVLASSVTVDQFTQGLNSTPHGQFLYNVAGPLICDVAAHHMQYWTVAPTPPSTTTTPTRVSAAVMIPTGLAAKCSGARPILLFAHGWDSDPAANQANIVPTVVDLRNQEIVAAFFAAQGYIVIAPNYAGYDISTLGYEPFLNADQNSKTMIDALMAAKAALPTLSSTTTPNSKLLVIGGSEGGFVAMATDKALQAAGIPVTATALFSGIYATEAYGDSLFLGHTNLGPALMAFLTTSYQNAYGNVYSSLTDVYSSAYTQYITNVLPGRTGGKLPDVFNGNPPFTGNVLLDAMLQPPTDAVYAQWFGNPYLVTDNYRRSYLEDVIAHPDGAIPPHTTGVPLATAPQNALRQDLRLNDMRSWTPQMPVLLCGGHQDHNVPYDVHTTTMAEYWSAQVNSGLVSVVDIDSTPIANDPYIFAKNGFTQWLGNAVATEGAFTAFANYHVIAGFYCFHAAREFLARF